jgi:hypothetical protein
MPPKKPTKKGCNRQRLANGRTKPEMSPILTDPKTGKLVPVKDKDDPKADQSNKVENPAQGQAKPMGTSAQAAGVAPNNMPTANDIQKIAKTSKPAGEETPEDNFAKTPSGEGSPMMAVKTNPHVLEMKMDIGTPIDKSQIKEYFPNDPYHLLDTEIIGEEVVVFNEREQTEFFQGTEQEIENRGRNWKKWCNIAYEQNNWRAKLSPKLRHALLKAGRIWQQHAIHKNADKEKVYSFFNKLCQKFKPTTKLSDPIYRGMRIPPDVASEFLKNFRLGESVDIPPSGFSMDRFHALWWGQPDTKNVSVLLRLAPKDDGTLYGLHLSNNVDEQNKNPEYEEELEVIRYSGPKAKCVNVTKVIAPEKSNRLPWQSTVSTEKLPTVCYVIDLEEQGFEDEQ